MHKEVESAYGPEIFEKEPTVQDAQDVVPIRSGDMGVAYVNFEKKLWKWDVEQLSKYP